MKRALSHNLRSTVEQCFENGEKVFFKRQDSRRWNGPGKVIGQDGKQVLVKNGGEMVRVHVSRLMKVLPTIEENKNEEPATALLNRGEVTNQKSVSIEEENVSDESKFVIILSRKE